MHRTKAIVIILLMSMLVLCLSNFSNATTVNVSRDVYSNNGSMKFNFTGLSLDMTHEYEFGLTKTAASQVETWNLITEYTATTASIDVITSNKKLIEVINAVDTGYITIKDKTTDKVVLNPYAVDLKTPYLQVTNYMVLTNGEDFKNKESIHVPLRAGENSKAYYQYEKITDEKIISKYKEIKSKNGDMLQLQSMLKTQVPTSSWSSWDYWGSFFTTDGSGYTQRTITAPSTGLYYMWVYFAGINVKNMYGYILVDNLDADVAVESISLPATAKVEVGKTLGSVVITAISEDGNKKATCTVTVTTSSKDNTNTNNTVNNTTTSNSTSKNNTISSSSNKTNTVNDTTIKGGVLPKTGIGFGLVIAIISLVGAGIFTYFKYNNLRDIK